MLPWPELVSLHWGFTPFHLIFRPCCLIYQSMCCEQTSFDTGGSCLTSLDSSLNRRYCGTDLCDASYKCTTACPGGTDAECPSGESCFDNTPCSSYAVPPSVEFAYCKSCVYYKQYLLTLPFYQ